MLSAVTCRLCCTSPAICTSSCQSCCPGAGSCSLPARLRGQSPLGRTCPLKSRARSPRCRRRLSIRTPARVQRAARCRPCSCSAPLSCRLPMRTSPSCTATGSCRCGKRHGVPPSSSSSGGKRNSMRSLCSRSTHRVRRNRHSGDQATSARRTSTRRSPCCQRNCSARHCPPSWPLNWLTCRPGTRASAQRLPAVLANIQVSASTSANRTPSSPWRPYFSPRLTVPAPWRNAPAPRPGHPADEPGRGAADRPARPSAGRYRRRFSGRGSPAS
ncbi:hypothetical protein D3C84_662810 [compost metagenome]